MSTAPDLETIKAILKKHLPPGYHAVLFGSRATGEARYNSDWDIGIIGDAPLPDGIHAQICADFENLPTLHTFDVVELAQTTEKFRQSALRKTISLV